MYIACPKCDWRPDAGDAWQCTCGHAWNTFQTQCLTCHQWSDHDDWYHDDDGLTVEEYVANPGRVGEPMLV